ncbi:CsgG/HfaB family protein [Spirochaetota bacterium]
MNVNKITNNVFIVLLILFISIPVISKEKTRIAVIDLKGEGISKVVASTITNLIRSHMVDSGLFTVVERAQMGEILKEQGLQMTGCTDSSCAVKVGKLLSARKILVGEVTKIGKIIIITVRVVDVERGVAEFSSNVKAKGFDNIDKSAKKLSVRLMERITGKSSTELFARKKRKKVYLDVTGRFSYMMTFGKFKDLSDTGYGGIFSITKDIPWNISAGINIGFYSFEADGTRLKNLYMVPFLLNVMYKWNTMANLYVMPGISYGGNYVTLKEYDKTDSSVGNMLKLGLGIRYVLWESFILHADIEYGIIIEKADVHNLLLTNIGVGYVF